MSGRRCWELAEAAVLLQLGEPKGRTERQPLVGTSYTAVRLEGRGAAARMVQRSWAAAVSGRCCTAAPRKLSGSCLANAAALLQWKVSRRADAARVQVLLTAAG